MSRPRAGAEPPCSRGSSSRALVVQSRSGGADRPRELGPSHPATSQRPRSTRSPRRLEARQRWRQVPPPAKGDDPPSAPVCDAVQTFLRRSHQSHLPLPTMSAPRHLWSDSWRAESAATGAELAAKRGRATEAAEEAPTETLAPHAELGVWARFMVWLREAARPTPKVTPPRAPTAS